MAAVKGQQGQAPGTIEDMQTLARRHNGRCLSSTYRDTKTKLLWQCDQGHTWESTPSNVKAGTWCQVCGKARREAHWLGEMQVLAQARGGKCLSIRYTRFQEKLRWECDQGHQWDATPASVKTSGSWCPVCSVEKQRLTIADMHAAARERGGECLSASYVDNLTRLRWRCAQGHEWDAKPMHIRLGQWCPRCGRQWRLLTMAQLQAMAQARGGTCLSTDYGNDGQKLRWRCAHGHEWMQTPSKIKGGSWCSRCVRNSYTIADMQTLARLRGGECLSDEYVNTQTKLRWRCDRGHEWSTRPMVIIKGHWCRECAWLDLSRKDRKRRRYLPVPDAA
jgi:hypothetical protein